MELLLTQFEKIPGSLLGSEEWKFLTGEEASLFLALEERFPDTLEDVTERIFQGLKTSADKIYILEVKNERDGFYEVYSNQTEKQYLLEKSFLFPLIKGGDSRIFQWFIEKISTQMRGGWYSLESRYIKNFPIPEQPESDSIIDKAKEIFQLKQSTPTALTASLEADLGLLVYKLYGLSWAEVKIVDPEFGMSKEEYEAAG